MSWKRIGPVRAAATRRGLALYGAGALWAPPIAAALLAAEAGSLWALVAAGLAGTLFAADLHGTVRSALLDETAAHTVACLEWLVLPDTHHRATRIPAGAQLSRELAKLRRDVGRLTASRATKEPAAVIELIDGAARKVLFPEGPEGGTRDRLALLLSSLLGHVTASIGPEEEVRLLDPALTAPAR